MSTTAANAYASALDLRLPSIESLWAERAQEQQDLLTKPQGSLGQLEALAIQLATIQQSGRPLVTPASAIIFAADHPVARHGTSAFPVEVTAAMVLNFLSGGAASSVLAESHGIPLTVVDVGVDTPYPAPQEGSERYHRYELEAGDITVEAALSEEHFARALQIGRQHVAALPEELKLLILGEMGIGNTTPSAAVASALLGGELDALVGRGTGISEAQIALKKELISRALRRWSEERAPEAQSVAGIMRQLGGRELAAILGAMIEAVERGIPILVDGFIISVVALALVRLHPAARAFLIFSHRSQERGHQRVLEAVGATPLLTLGLRLGEASGALTAYPLLRSACTLHNQMATFAEASVPNREDAPKGAAIL